MKNDREGAFQKAYERLNDKQREAVDTIEGPVMVIAGPGTGKTQILTLRIANILKQTQMQPENILALTFTTSGVKAMRDRLVQFIGAAAYRVTITTFHGLAERLIRAYPDAYTKIIGSQAASDIEKIETIETILLDDGLRLLRPTGAPEFYVKPLLSIISHMKQENVTPDGLLTIIAEEESRLVDIPQYHEKGAHKGKERSEYTKLVANLEKLRALHIVYRQYETIMRTKKRYDFDDMIIETVRVLTENESVRLDLQETYQYILADEHQDVNGAQNEILVQLTSYHNSPNLFVVGDEKQAIYRFQGASLENFLLFETLFPDTRVIVLTNNYRSTQPILDAGHALVAVEDGPLVDYRIPLSAQTTEETTLSMTAFEHEQFEHQALIEMVQETLGRGVPPEEIAIIVRSNREVESLADLLTGAGIAVEASADADILEHPLFLSILDLLEVVVNPANTAAFARVCLSPYTGMEMTDVMLVMSCLSFGRPLEAALRDRDFLISIGVSNVSAIADFLKKLQTYREQLLIVPPHRLLATVINDMGLFRIATAREPFSGARVIRRLYDEVEAQVQNGEAKTLTDTVRLLRRRIDYRTPLSAPFVQGGLSAVQVMTAHKSKGLEFHTVIIPHLHESLWGARSHAEYFKVPLTKTATMKLESNEDERRLLYVAMTRAKRVLRLMYSTATLDGKAVSPSGFLTTVEANVSPTEPAVTPDPAALPLAVIVPPSKQLIQAILVRHLTERGISATALNNCLKNPWHYLFRNVIHLPEVQELPMLFGTAMHSVLEMATKVHTTTGTLPDFAAARNHLEQALGQLPLGTVEFTDLFAKGQEVLASYLPHLGSTLPLTTKEELSVKVLWTTGHPLVPIIPLTGKLDRIDLDASGQATRVVDYKTGRAKTRNDIEGKTAAADASYRRQLSFYAVLLSLYDDKRYETEVGTLSFIEPDSKGRIHEETFVSGESEQETLKGEILAAIETLVSGDFLENEALLEASDYAAIGTFLQQG